MSKASQISAIIALLAMACWIWLATLLIHELGHVVAAISTGGKLVSVELRAGWLPHTLVQPNPHPSLVLWSGFAVGMIVPQLVAIAWSSDHAFTKLALKVWAGFCVLFSGVYLAVGGMERLTDTSKLVEQGWPLSWLVAGGTALAIVGYAQSRHHLIAFAKRLDTRPVTPRIAVAWCGWLAVGIAGQWWLNLLLQPGANVR